MTRYLRYCLVTPLLMHAQVAEVEMSAPTLGYVLDGTSRQLHALEGVPGAAVLGRGVHLGAPIDKVWLSASRRYGLAVSGSALLLIKLDGGSGAAIAMGDGQPEAAGFSPDGRWAAIARGGAVELWQGFPDRPALAGSYRAPDGGVAKVAVSDDGSRIAAISGSDLVLVSERSHAIASDGRYVDLCFLGSSHTLLALDGAAGRLVSWQKVGEPGESAILLDGLEGAQALGMAADESVVAVLNPGAVVLLERSSGKTRTLQLPDTEMDGLWRTTGNSVFQLNRAADRRIWLVDGDSAAPRLFSAAGRTNE